MGPDGIVNDTPLLYFLVNRQEYFRSPTIFVVSVLARRIATSGSKGFS